MIDGMDEVDFVSLQAPAWGDLFSAFEFTLLPTTPSARHAIESPDDKIEGEYGGRKFDSKFDRTDVCELIRMDARPQPSLDSGAQNRSRLIDIEGTALAKHVNPLCV